MIAAATAAMKRQKKHINAIKDFLTAQAGTIPDIAKGTNLPTDQTLWYIATLKKYGQILEGEKQGAFFLYVLNDPEKTHEKAEV